MPDEITQDDADVAAAGGDGQTSDGGADSTTGAQATAGGADTGKTFTQADVDRIAQERAAREKRAADKRQAELQAEIDRYKQAEQEKQDAELSEIERVKKAAAEATAAKDAAEAKAAAQELRAVRADLIASDPEAAALPAAYKNLIVGDTPEALAEAVANAKAEWAKDREAALSGAKPQPANLGTTSAVPGQPGVTPPGDIAQMSDKQFAEHLTRKGIRLPGT